MAKSYRKDGPAAEYAHGDKEWYLNGKRHREDGPAIEWVDGSKEWWLDGKKLSKSEFKAQVYARTQAKELTVADIEKLLGHKVKIVKG